MSLIAPGAPKKQEKEPDRRAFQERNRLVLFTVTAFLVGLLAALHLGAVARADFKDVPGWLTAIASVLATGTSVIAVYLVFQTLRATRETLDITQEMTRDQRRTGEAQIRPFILFKRERYQVNDGKIHGFIVLRNYGNTPAIRVRVDADVYLTFYKTPNGEPGSDAMTGQTDSLKRLAYEAVVPPGGDVEAKIVCADNIDRSLGYFSAEFSWRYYSHDGEEKYVGEHNSNFPEIYEL